MQLTASFLCPSSLSGLSTAKRKFADSLNEFKFQCIGDAETDDEICIGEVADLKFNIQYVTYKIVSYLSSASHKIQPGIYK